MIKCEECSQEFEGGLVGWRQFLSHLPTHGILGAFSDEVAKNHGLGSVRTHLGLDEIEVSQGPNRIKARIS